MKPLGLVPDPGQLPRKPAPKAAERIRFSVSGLPPYKDSRFSIRNPKHPKHKSFLELRTAATRAMNGRKWYDGPVELKLVVRSKFLKRPMLDYVGGVMDTLDGSHGPSFTYLPIVYQDDCQVSDIASSHFVRCDMQSYTVEVLFLRQRHRKHGRNVAHLLL